MEALIDAIGLRAVGLGSGVIDVLNGQVELIGMVLWPAAPTSRGSLIVLRSPICQDALQLDTLLIKEGNHTVIEQISCCDRRLVCVELDISYPAIGVDEGLLIDSCPLP